MAYCRFIESDAYIYDDIHHKLICCACSLMPIVESHTPIFGEYERYFINNNFIAGDDYNKMLAHIAEHRVKGEYIPERVDEVLILERDCVHEWMSTDYGNYCEKCGKPYHSKES